MMSDYAGRLKTAGASSGRQSLLARGERQRDVDCHAGRAGQSRCSLLMSRRQRWISPIRLTRWRWRIA
ncbi:hypothetical protein KCP76_14635 [Salmonella enterica subsp. enterica serovar Weltevreden]|nr:hypothetical protein KCP76_14635 [Salmonella enterica subsp. enterica serovar Weltevreden]